MQNWDQIYGGSYDNYAANHEYSIDPGTFALPVAADPATFLDTDSPVVVVQAYTAHRVRQTTFTAKKLGTPPVLPSPESSGKFEFLGGSLLMPQPPLNIDLSTHIWEATGSYTFVETVKHDVSDGFVLMSLPFSTQTQRDAYQHWAGAAPGATGAVADAGRFAKVGYEQNYQVDFNQDYGYNVPAYWPGKFFNAGLINGESEQ